ncbi:hypothetical protein KOR42_47980 [Thalassoglobus neptunius]|uniref:Uncharacterized protein n=1 Tax=Thalassoglobus neptunius TaxID=1938619 RepID=A0A5C5VU51_9PLAN|nr:hypothetical protein [Thalassoglobus neptunius]TWT41445.1 hypothetical protein KOR42_47980 [Thalassoglobus neptunius]
MSSTVVVQSPFLTAEQVASELGTTPFNVRRLAATGKIEALYGSEDQPTFKILPENVRLFLVSGSGVTNPPNIQEGVIHDNFNNNQSSEFLEKARKLVGDFADSQEEPLKQSTNSYIEKVSCTPPGLAALLLVPAREYSKIERQKARGKTLAEEFGIYRFRQLALGIADRDYRDKRNVLKQESPVEILYKNRVQFLEIMIKAWKEFLDSGVCFARRTFSGVTRNSGTPITFTYVLYGSSLKLDVKEMIEKSF